MVTIQLNNSQYSLLINAYKDYEVPSNGDYICFSAIYNGTRITVYRNKKDEKKATFVNGNCLEEARRFDINAAENEVKRIVKEDWLDLTNQIGSDEVGVGDLLLPMIVVAAYVDDNDTKTLIDLGIHDSKKITDKRIMELGPKLIKLFDGKFSKLTLSNAKYNEMLKKGENLNSMKARMHNQALANMLEAHKDAKHVYVDQFVNEDKYYSYLAKDAKIVDKIVFRTKGESYYPSVALASVIARYSFLLTKEKIEERYKMEIPFGAAVKADEVSKLFIKKYGKEEFKKIAKLNFKNCRDLLND